MACMCSLSVSWRKTVSVGILLLCMLSAAEAKKKHSSTYMEKEIRLLRDDCETSVQREGGECTASDINKENCILKCMNPDCYEQIYGRDSLEEGEVDARRGKDFRTCIRKALKEQAAIL